jgi:hypothetical protein
VIEWLCPATATLPVRAVVDAFAPIEYDTVPGPLPLAPALRPIHAALGVAVHAQPDAAVTVTVPVPPPLSIVALAGEIVNEQTGAGSVGDVLSQLTTAVDNKAASDAQTTSLACMTQLLGCDELVLFSFEHGACQRSDLSVDTGHGNWRINRPARERRLRGVAEIAPGCRECGNPLDLVLDPQPMRPFTISGAL